MFKKYQHIHFVGIGGMGMSGIAQVLLTLGYRITGSDLKRSSVTAKLIKRGAKIMIGHKEENIGLAHVVVISSAVYEDNPEVLAARRKGIPVVPRAEMLAELMRLKYGIAVAGTHGKTTTTSLIATVLETAGLDPTIIIGGKVNSFRTNARLGKGEYLVAEADESDRSFVKLTPTIAVITNIDPEHMENYRDFEHVKETYISFANKVPFYGSVIACSDHPTVKGLLEKFERPIITYGIDSGKYNAKNIIQDGEILEFDVYNNGGFLGRASLSIPGRHNVLNALAAIAVGYELDIPFAKIKKGLAKFRGIERRFQIILNKNGGPMVISDYAHHPQEIEAVLSAASSGWAGRKLICVMQPHRYTRLKNLFDDFVNVLSAPPALAILPLYPAGETPIAGVSSETLYHRLLNVRPGNKETFYAKDKKSLFCFLKESAGRDGIVMFLGAGDVWKMAKEFGREASC